MGIEASTLILKLPLLGISAVYQRQFHGSSGRASEEWGGGGEELVHVVLEERV